MIAEYIRLNIPVKDEEFDKIYPVQLQKLSGRHFTKVAVAIKAARFLATQPNQKILDIGCGPGKFCFIAGSYNNASYTGVDYRKHFIELCTKLSHKHHFKNVNFIHADIKEIDFCYYNGFYFFNSFQEHIDKSAQLDDTIETSIEKFNDYTAYLKKEWGKLPAGTRIATYHAYLNQVPSSYKLIDMHFDGLLKCWEKVTDR